MFDILLLLRYIVFYLIIFIFKPCLHDFEVLTLLVDLGFELSLLFGLLEQLPLVLVTLLEQLILGLLLDDAYTLSPRRKQGIGQLKIAAVTYLVRLLLVALREELAVLTTLMADGQAASSAMMTLLRRRQLVEGALADFAVQLLRGLVLPEVCVERFEVLR